MSFEAFSRRALELRGRRQREQGAAGEGEAPELVVLAVVDSTNRLASRIVRDFAREEVRVPPIDLLAYEQAAGRGRDGRAWSSPPGAGVYATLLRVIPVERLQLLPLEIAAVLGETLGRRLGGRVRLKWPNDLMIEGRKLGGILVESSSRGTDTALVVIGFGVNVAPDLAVFDAPAPTSLGVERGGGDDPGALAELAEELLAAVDAALRAGAPAAEVVERYRALSAHVPGDRLVCRVDEDVIEGRFRELDAQGFLRLDVDGTERRISAGEVIG